MVVINSFAEQKKLMPRLGAGPTKVPREKLKD
jgi:hypothetical protein